MISHRGVYGGKEVKWGHFEQRQPGSHDWDKVYFEVSADIATIAPHLMFGNKSMMCDDMPPHPHILTRETLEKILKEMDSCKKP
jgi:hypothetical protein